MGLVFGLLMDTSVFSGSGYNRVNNIGLMQQQQNVLIVSGLVVLIGFFMTKNKNMDNSKTKKCLYCAESIKIEAVLCRFCGGDVKHPD